MPKATWYLPWHENLDSYGTTHEQAHVTYCVTFIRKFGNVMETAIASTGKPKIVDRSKITLMLVKLFELWHLTTQEQLDALGLSVDNRSALARYRKGKPIASSRDMMDRAGNLLAIHKSLRLLFPRNPDLAYSWMRTRNKAFHGRTPIETIREMGFSGLLYVRNYLDRASDQILMTGRSAHLV